MNQVVYKILEDTEFEFTIAVVTRTYFNRLFKIPAPHRGVVNAKYNMEARRIFVVKELTPELRIKSLEKLLKKHILLDALRLSDSTRRFIDEAAFLEDRIKNNQEYQQLMRRLRRVSYK